MTLVHQLYSHVEREIIIHYLVVAARAVLTAMPEMPKHRHHFGTQNNYPEYITSLLDSLLHKGARYVVYGKEVAPRPSTSFNAKN